jgi:hypothetical protein
VAPDGGLILPRPVGPDGEPIGDDVQLYVSPKQLALVGWCNLPFVLIPVTMVLIYSVVGAQRSRAVNFANPREVAAVCAFLFTWAVTVLSFYVRFRVRNAVDGQVYLAEVG